MMTSSVQHKVVKATTKPQRIDRESTENRQRILSGCGVHRQIPTFGVKIEAGPNTKPSVSKLAELGSAYTSEEENAPPPASISSFAFSVIIARPDLALSAPASAAS